MIRQVNIHGFIGRTLKVKEEEEEEKEMFYLNEYDSSSSVPNLVERGKIFFMPQGTRKMRAKSFSQTIFGKKRETQTQSSISILWLKSDLE